MLAAMMLIPQCWCRQYTSCIITVMNPDFPDETGFFSAFDSVSQ